MAEDAWHEARLIPTSGISGAEEQERRATSAVLAVMTSVREFGRALTQPLCALEFDDMGQSHTVTVPRAWLVVHTVRRAPANGRSADRWRGR